MTVQPADAFEVLRKLRMDLTNAQAKITNVLSILSALNLSDTPVDPCPHCGLVTKGPRTLAEHVHLLHDGPVPEHFAATEAMSA